MRAQSSNGRSIQPALKTHYAGISAAVAVEIFDKRGRKVRASALFAVRLWLAGP